MRDAYPSVESSPARPSGASSQEDCLPFLLDDESSGQDGTSSVLKTKGSIRPTYGFSVDSKADRSPVSSPSKNVDISRFSSPPNKVESTSYGRDSYRARGINFQETAVPRKGIDSGSTLLLWYQISTCCFILLFVLIFFFFSFSQILW